MARIQNVVFDMGGVLLDFDPPRFTAPHTDDAADARAIEEAVFLSPSWALLDAGVISEETMERVAQARLPERLWPTLHAVLLDWHLRLPVLTETSDLAVRAHEAGLGCYLLSNAGTRWVGNLDRIPCARVMDGIMLSALERLMKPDPQIFLALCERYGLDPATCLFVDDNLDNVRGAEVAGMQAYLFDTHGSAAAGLEAFLREKGIAL